MDVIGDATAVVTGPTFVKNRIGARTGGGLFSAFSITNSVFLRNDVGFHANLAPVTVSCGLLVKNRVGVLVRGWQAPGDILRCATLSKVTFVRNRTNLDGPKC